MLCIGVDIDDTLADFISPLNDYVNKKLGTNYKITDYQYNSIKDSWSILSEKKIRKIIKEFVMLNKCLSLLPISGAYEALNEIKNYGGVKFYAITDRSVILREASKNWLDAHFPKIFTDLILCNDCQGEKKNKIEVCKNHDIKVYIDDEKENFISCNELNNIRFILHKRPWNSGIDWNVILLKLRKFYNKHICQLEIKLLTNPLLIAISGKIGSGKGTVAEIIKKKFPSFKTCAFASRVKETVAALTCTSIEMNYDRKQKGYIPVGFTESLGQLHQKVGAGMKEILGPYIWINCLLSFMKENCIITDCRHLIEVNACLEQNALLIRINGDPANIRKFKSCFRNRIG